MTAAQVSSAEFSDVARRLAGAARAAGLIPPTFRTPPRDPLVSRSVRRMPGGVVVSVRIRDRAQADVYADMIDGVIWANSLVGTAADRVRSGLVDALAVEMTGAELYEDHTGRTG